MVRMEGQLLNDIIQTTNGLGHTAIHMIIELVGHLRVMVFLILKSHILIIGLKIFQMESQNLNQREEII